MLHNRCKLNARVISCTSFVAVDEAGSPSVVRHISMGLSVSQSGITRKIICAKRRVARVSLYHIVTNEL